MPRAQRRGELRNEALADAVPLPGIDHRDRDFGGRRVRWRPCKARDADSL
jgi:hypothetical protein